MTETRFTLRYVFSNPKHARLKEKKKACMLQIKYWFSKLKIAKEKKKSRQLRKVFFFFSNWVTQQSNQSRVNQAKRELIIVTQAGQWMNSCVLLVLMTSGQTPAHKHAVCDLPEEMDAVWESRRRGVCTCVYVRVRVNA